MSKTEIKVPDIGDFDGVEVIELLVEPGDTVEAEQPLIVLESDKATMEVPSTVAGTITEISVALGDKVAEGDVVAVAEASDGDSAATQSSEDEPEEDAASEEEDAQEPQEDTEDEASDEQEESAASGETRSTEIKVPDIGDFDAVEVIEVLVAEGDSVEVEQPLVVLESDKATMEVPSTVVGTLTAIKVSVGDKVSEGDVVAMADAQHAGKTASKSSEKQTKSDKKPQKEEKSTEKQPSVKPEKPQSSDPHAEGVARDAETHERFTAHLRRSIGSPEENAKDQITTAHASPSVRRFARELGADLGRIQGSGRKGRVTKEDVKAFVKGIVQGSGQAPTAAGATSGAGIPPMPEVDFSKFGDIEKQPLSRIKKRSAANLHRSWLNVPHVTQFDQADITELEAFRQEQKNAKQLEGGKLTMLAFLIKAAGSMLQEFPSVNASLDADGEHIILKKYVHIGVAVDTPNGLVVPVLRDVDKKGLFDLAKELGEISVKARDGKLHPKDMQGGCFSISSLGGIGGTAFTPIVNAPEVAILGVSKSSMQPVWNGSEFEPKLVLPLSLSYDHRVIDGAQAARMTGYLSEVLGDIRRLLL